MADATVDPCAPETMGQRMAGGTLLDRAQEEAVERLDRIDRLRQLHRGTSKLVDTAHAVFGVPLEGETWELDLHLARVTCTPPARQANGTMTPPSRPTRR